MMLVMEIWELCSGYQTSQKETPISVTNEIIDLEDLCMPDNFKDFAESYTNHHDFSSGAEGSNLV